ncbi:hypothetical protein KEM54_005635 [Ascosphaera aggregata]|nr:hypothetical protein KEM54_005635 [Ascosphaera aggregata]
MKICLLFLAAAASAAPVIYDPHVVHEQRDAECKQFTVVGRPSPTTGMLVRVGLVQSNMDKLHDLLLEVSDPTSKKYGNYYTQQQINDIFAPSNETVKAVADFLEANGISKSRIYQSQNKQWLQFNATPAEAEKAFKAKYLVYSSKTTGKKLIATKQYSVPKSVQPHIDYISPGVKLGEYAKLRNQNVRQIHSDYEASSNSVKPDNISLCNQQVTPECIKAMYKIPVGNLATSGNELGIFEEGDYFAQEDLDLFFANIYPTIPQGTGPKVDSVDGGEAPVSIAESGVESCLDFDIAYPIIWPQGTILFQTDDAYYSSPDAEGNNGFLNTFLEAIDGSYCSYDDPLDPQYPDHHPGGYDRPKMCGVYKMPNVLSVSYGAAEADFPIRYAHRQCKEWAKLGMQGKTIVVSSGDSGVEGRYSDPTPSECLGKKNDVFVPQFPVSCPYITAVGATYLGPDGDVKLDNEVAVTSFPSGGGFSNVFERPSWQSDAVRNYFDIAKPEYPYYKSVDNSSFNDNGGVYNRIGRGYPDVAAVGDNIIIINQGSAELMGGTSASAPAFASIITRINEELLGRGKPTVGFINPTIYANADAFNDVTVGTNPGCGTQGFSAAKGWDPLTGLGTPNYPKLLKVFMNAAQ